MEITQQSTDILVIGSGLAGLRAALEVCQAGLRVILVTKGDMASGSNSYIASGGFATALPGVDSPEVHEADMLDGGYAVNDRELVSLICTEAYKCLSELDQMVGGFPRTGDRFTGDAVPAHSRPRSVRYPPGMSFLLNTLVAKISEYPGVILEHYRVVDLVTTNSGGITGALLFNEDADKLMNVQARSTILATGGCGYLFPITSNSSEITGDGSAIALRAGCRLRDMEFIQFTPTAFAAPAAIRGRTISGSLLAVEGVVLLNTTGERFLTRYAPRTLERSNRAVVARSIFREIQAGRGTQAGGVYMDLRSVSVDRINKLRPGLVEFCSENGIDVRTEPLETAPAVHTSLGGVAVDDQFRAAENLYVAGEAIGGTHGANRLSSNSLTEANVTGTFAARAAIENLKNSPRLPQTGSADYLVDHLPKRGSADTGDLIEKIRALMNSSAGIERNEISMLKGLDQLTELESVHHACAQSGPDNLGRWLDMRNMILTGRAILRSALQRRESRGAHYRTDFPETDDANGLGNIFTRYVPAAQSGMDSQACRTTFVAFDRNQNQTK